MHPSVKLDGMDLDCFLACSELGSIRRAASHLGIQQSAVSRRLIRLEYKLGVDLFFRSYSGVNLTAAGHIFYSYAEQARLDFRTVLEIFEERKRRESDSISIQVVAPLSSAFLKELFRRFRGANPEVRISFCSHERVRESRQIAGGFFDLSFVPRPRCEHGKEWRKLWVDRLYVVCSKEHPISKRRRLSWSDIRSQKIVFCDLPLDRSLFDLLKEKCKQHTNNLSCEFYLLSRDDLMYLVASNVGISLAYGSQIKSIRSEEKAIPIEGECVSFFAVWEKFSCNPYVGEIIKIANSLKQEGSGGGFFEA